MIEAIKDNWWYIPPTPDEPDPEPVIRLGWRPIDPYCEQYPTEWRGITPYCVKDSSNNNTGYRAYANLEEWVPAINEVTGFVKPNNSGDPDYISPTYNTSICPLPVVPEPEPEPEDNSQINWLLMGDQTMDDYYTSLDGNTWTKRTIPNFGVSFFTGWINNKWFIGGKGVVAMSDNGTSYQVNLAPLIAIQSITWNGSLYIAVGAGDNHNIATSVDGITWIGRGKLGGGARLFDIKYNGQVTIAVGEQASKDQPNLFISTDGINWTSKVLQEVKGGRSIDYYNGIWGISGISANYLYNWKMHDIFRSEDNFESWTTQEIIYPGPYDAPDMYHVKCVNGIWIAAADPGYATASIATSIDLINWTIKDIPDWLGALNDMSSYDNTIIGTGALDYHPTGLALIKSTNKGITWSVQSLNYGTSYCNIAGKT